MSVETDGGDDERDRFEMAARRALAEAVADDRRRVEAALVDLERAVRDGDNVDDDHVHDVVRAVEPLVTHLGDVAEAFDVGDEAAVERRLADTLQYGVLADALGVDLDDASAVAAARAISAGDYRTGLGERVAADRELARARDVRHHLAAQVRTLDARIHTLKTDTLEGTTDE
jgi:hypothetical protein